MAYSDDSLQFDKDLLDALKDAQLEMAKSGGVKTIKKGDYMATYRSPAELEAAISKLELSLHIRENGCLDRRLCQ